MSFKNLIMHENTFKKLTFFIKNFKFIRVIYTDWIKFVLSLKDIELSYCNKSKFKQKNKTI